MVRFSLSEEQEDKRRRVLHLPASSTSPSAPCLPFADERDGGSDDDDHVGHDAEATGVPTVVGDDAGGRGGTRAKGGDCGGKEILTVTMDPDTLDCPICCENLSPPIFQCRNGHISCADCCSKMTKCHSCLCPMGTSRCLALEHVIESIKLLCPFAGFGCRELVNFTQRNSHRMACPHSPCCCPIAGCFFSGSSRQLSHHFRARHGDQAVPFTYHLPFKVSVGSCEPLRVLLADDGALFLLLNKGGAPVGGNAVTVVLIGPDSMKGGFSYQLIARSEASSIQIESTVTNISRWDGVYPSRDVLVIPRDFCGVDCVLHLDVCVRKKSHEPISP